MSGVHVEQSVENRALSAVSEALVGAATDLSLDAVLERLVRAARDLVGARYAALGVPDGEGGFARFLTAGMEPELVESLGPLPRSHGLLDVMLTQTTPYRTDDVRRDPRFRGWWPRQHPEMRSFLGYPIVFKGDVIGAFYLTDKVGVPSFDDTDEHLIGIFAPHAAVLVEYARLYEQSRELSVVGERNRIARELHDALTQTLFGARLAIKTATLALGVDEQPTAASATGSPEEPEGGASDHGGGPTDARAGDSDHAGGRREARGEPPSLDSDDAGPDLATAREQLRRATGLVNDAFGELRALILDLRPPDLETDRLCGAIRKQLALIERTSGLDVDLQVDDTGEIDDVVEPETERQLLRIVQEAVTNVVRHAQARSLTVSIGLEPESTAGERQRDGRMLRVEIRDDGVGFDPAERGIRSRRMGLTSMSDRVDSIGGELTIESAPGSGTTVRAEVPIA